MKYSQLDAALVLSGWLQVWPTKGNKEFHFAFDGSWKRLRVYIKVDKTTPRRLGMKYEAQGVVVFTIDEPGRVDDDVAKWVLQEIGRDG